MVMLSLWIQGGRDAWYSSIGSRRGRGRRILAIRGSRLAGGRVMVAEVSDDEVNSDLVRVAKLQKKELVNIKYYLGHWPQDYV